VSWAGPPGAGPPAREPGLSGVRDAGAATDPDEEDPEDEVEREED
jgi:hypothetical protein